MTIEQQPPGSDAPVALPLADAIWRAQCAEHVGVPGIVDLRRLARDDDSITGCCDIDVFKRIVADLPAQTVVETVSSQLGREVGHVWFEAAGSSHLGRRDRLSLKVQCLVVLSCQRCNQPMLYPIDELVEFELFDDSRLADASLTDDEFDPDAPEPLVLDGGVNLGQLIEDQLILAIPYVPKHVACVSFDMPDDGDVEEQVASPFQVLEQLKGKGNK